MTRSETAELLREIADELDSSRGAVHVPVGNKRVRLSPPEELDVEATVTERSRRLRKDTEEIELGLKWNPTGETESEAAEASRAENDATPDVDR